jgi:membrane-associated phospholipid phosphatase
MPMRKFLPYDILGAGLWATTFCVLGYVFWRSFDQLTSWVSRGLFAFGLVVALIVGIVFLVRLQRNPELRAKTARWIDAQLEKPLLRPAAPALRGAWQRIVRPAAGAAEGPARFVWNRITPGDFGLEVTTLLAAGAVGSFVFFLLADMLDQRDVLPGDRLAADIAARIDVPVVEGVAEVLSVFASLPVVALIVAATTAWAFARRRLHEAAVLPLGLALTWLAVEIAKRVVDRPRPANELVETTGSAYPSAHAAYAVLYVACAIVLARAGSGPAARFAVVTFAIVLAAALGLSRVLLRASHLSDVEGGAGLATAILALLGVLAIVVAHLRHNGRPEP